MTGAGARRAAGTMDLHPRRPHCARRPAAANQEGVSATAIAPTGAAPLEELPSPAARAPRPRPLRGEPPGAGRRRPPDAGAPRPPVPEADGRDARRTRPRLPRAGPRLPAPTRSRHQRHGSGAPEPSGAGRRGGDLRQRRLWRAHVPDGRPRRGRGGAGRPRVGRGGRPAAGGGGPVGAGRQAPRLRPRRDLHRRSERPRPLVRHRPRARGVDGGGLRHFAGRHPGGRGGLGRRRGLLRHAEVPLRPAGSVSLRLRTPGSRRAGRAQDPAPPPGSTTCRS